MLRIWDLVEGVKYMTNEMSGGYTYSIENNVLYVTHQSGKITKSNQSYNDVLTFTFTECEFEPKVGDRLWFPTITYSEGVDTMVFDGDETSERIISNIKKRVGLYRTKEGALTKAKELGWI